MIRVRIMSSRHGSKPCCEHLHAALPGSLLGKAPHYLSAQWPKPVRFVDGGAWPIDSKLCENAIRHGGPWKGPHSSEVSPMTPPQWIAVGLWHSVHSRLPIQTA